MAKDLGGGFCAANGNGNARDGAAHDISASNLRSSIRTTQIKLMLLVGLWRVGCSSRGYIIVAVVFISRVLVVIKNRSYHDYASKRSKIGSHFHVGIHTYFGGQKHWRSCPYNNYVST